jgi:hypothetical protein
MKKLLFALPFLVFISACSKGVPEEKSSPAELVQNIAQKDTYDNFVEKWKEHPEEFNSSLEIIDIFISSMAEDLSKVSPENTERQFLQKKVDEGKRVKVCLSAIKSGNETPNSMGCRKIINQFESVLAEKM